MIMIIIIIIIIQMLIKHILLTSDAESEVPVVAWWVKMVSRNHC